VSSSSGEACCELLYPVTTYYCETSDTCSEFIDMDRSLLCQFTLWLFWGSAEFERTYATYILRVNYVRAK